MVCAGVCVWVEQNEGIVGSPGFYKRLLQVKSTGLLGQDLLAQLLLLLLLDTNSSSGSDLAGLDSRFGPTHAARLRGCGCVALPVLHRNTIC